MVSSMRRLFLGFGYRRKQLLGAAPQHRLQNSNVVNSKFIPSPIPWSLSSLSSSLCLVRGLSRFGSSVSDDDDEDDDDDDDDVASNRKSSSSSSHRRRSAALPMRFSSGEEPEEHEEEPRRGEGVRRSAAAARYGTNPNSPPEPIPNRPLRHDLPTRHRRGDHMEQPSPTPPPTFHRQNMSINNNEPMVALGGKRPTPPPPPPPFPSDGGDSHRSPRTFLNFDNLDSGKGKLYGGGDRFPAKEASAGNQLSGYSFLERFRLGAEKTETPPQAHPVASATAQIPNGKQEEPQQASGPEVQPEEPEEPEDADKIFKKMKENGLIPNAVAMLDGLCKDGLVQEAMKLFGLMREKGTFPEVVIYTAVIDGFCKAHKPDDAVRIFRKMENNGISPNAFTYFILIRGLYKNKRLDDAADYSVEMIEAGHSPNSATFVGLVNCFCQERSVEEAQTIINRLSDRGYSFDEKAVREFLDKRGPFTASVWEAIFGKKCSDRLGI